MKIGYTDNQELYKFNNRHKLEIIFFKFGFIFSSTSRKPVMLDIYDFKTDEVLKGPGVKRISNFIKLKKQFPFIYRDSILKHNIPIDLI